MVSTFKGYLLNVFLVLNINQADYAYDCTNYYYPIIPGYIFHFENLQLLRI